MRKPPSRHLSQLGVGTRLDFVVGLARGVQLAQAFVAERDLVDDRQAPHVLFGGGGETLVDGEGVENVAVLEQFVGDLVAGPALPIDPAARIGLATAPFFLEQIQGDRHGLLRAIELAQRGGQQVASLGAVAVVGPIGQIGFERGDGGGPFARQLLRVRRHEEGAGLIGGCQVEQPHFEEFIQRVLTVINTDS